MFIRNRNFKGLGLMPYHDPVYDETGGQGAAVQTTAPVPANDPTLLYVMFGVLIFFMLQDD